MTSATIIDLVFLDTDMNAKFKHISIHKDSPSDHFLVKFALDVSVPKVYTTNSFYMDPSRRPAIPKDKLANSILWLKQSIDRDFDKFDSMTQSQVFEWIEAKLVELLDSVCHKLKKPVCHKLKKPL